jgi:hypothetical protein
LVSHGLLGFAFWQLLWRNDLDDEAAPAARHRPPGFGQPGTVPERPVEWSAGENAQRPVERSAGENAQRLEAKPEWSGDA